MLSSHGHNTATRLSNDTGAVVEVFTYTCKSIYILGGMVGQPELEHEGGLRVTNGISGSEEN